MVPAEVVLECDQQCLCQWQVLNPAQCPQLGCYNTAPALLHKPCCGKEPWHSAGVHAGGPADLFAQTVRLMDDNLWHLSVKSGHGSVP